MTDLYVRSMYRARLLESLRMLAACSPITLRELEASFRVEYVNHELSDDQRESAGAFAMLCCVLADMGSAKRAIELVGPLPAPFSSTVKEPSS